jgi:hypothetical protein
MIKNASVAQSGLARRWRDYRPSKKLLAAACAGTMVLTVVLGLSCGFWISSGRAAMLSRMAADHARAELAATVCVNRFLAAPDVATRLDALRKRDAWYRGEALEDAGWTALAGLPDLPGSREPVAGAADLCAQRLTAITLPAPASVDVGRSAAVHRGDRS